MSRGNAHRFLEIGEIAFTNTPMEFVTVLGSCISVTFYNKDRKLAGICHGFLPKCKHSLCDNQCLKETKYVDCAIKTLVDKFTNEGINISKLDVNVIGGSNMLKSVSNKQRSIGELNTESAIKTLKSLGIRPVQIDCGGDYARKVVFDSHTGFVGVTVIK